MTCLWILVADSEKYLLVQRAQHWRNQSGRSAYSGCHSYNSVQHDTNERQVPAYQLSGCSSQHVCSIQRPASLCGSASNQVWITSACGSHILCLAWVLVAFPFRCSLFGQFQKKHTRLVEQIKDAAVDGRQSTSSDHSGSDSEMDIDYVSVLRWLHPPSVFGTLWQCPHVVCLFAA